MLNSGTLTIAGTNASPATYAGVISDTGFGSVIKNGGGTQIFTGANTYGGATTVNGGLLTVDHSGANGGSIAGSTLVTVNGGGTLLFKGNASVGGDLTVAGGVTAATAGAVSLQDGAIGSLSVPGNLTLGDANGGAVLDFDLGATGNSTDAIDVGGFVNTTGNTIVNLSIPTLPTGKTSYTLIDAAGGLAIGGGGFTVGSHPVGLYSYDFLSSTGTAEILTITPTVALPTAYWTGAASLAGGDSANNWSFGTASSNWSSNATGTADTFQVPNITTDVIFTANNASTIGGAIGTRLDAAFSIKSLTFDTSTTTQSVTSVTIDTNGNILQLDAGGLTIASADKSDTVIGGAGSVLLGVFYGTNQNWANNATLGKSLTVNAPITGTATSGTQTLTFNGTGTGGITLDGTIGDGSQSQLALVFGQAGTTILSGSNTFTGGVTINSGTVKLANFSALNATTPDAVAFGPASTGVLQVNGNDVTISGLGTNANVGSPAIENANAFPGILTVDVATGTNTFGGVMRDGAGAGSLNFTKSGGGTLVLTAASTFTGATNITAGTVTLDHSAGNSGALGATAVSVSSGATLRIKGNAGIGSSLTPTGGEVNLQDGTINTLTVAGNLDLESGSGASLLDFDIGSASGSADSINVGGSVTTNGITTINLSIPTVATGAYTLISAPGGGLTAGGAGFALGATPGGFYTYTLSASTSTAEILTIVAPPAIAYWTGAGSAVGGDSANNWSFGTSTTNWSSDASGATDTHAVPGGNTNVFFTASNATAGGGALATELDANFSIDSLTFNTAAVPAITNVGIDTNGNMLTIYGGGLTLASADTSSVSLGGFGVLAIGANQNWANNSNSRSLNVTASINGTSTTVGGVQTLTFNGTGTGGIALGGSIGDGAGGGKLALAFNQAGVTTIFRQQYIHRRRDDRFGHGSHRQSRRVELGDSQCRRLRRGEQRRFATRRQQHRHRRAEHRSGGRHADRGERQSHGHPGRADGQHSHRDDPHLRRLAARRQRRRLARLEHRGRRNPGLDRRKHAHRTHQYLQRHLAAQRRREPAGRQRRHFGRFGSGRHRRHAPIGRRHGSGQYDASQHLGEQRQLDRQRRGRRQFRRLHLDDRHLGQRCLLQRPSRRHGQRQQPGAGRHRRRQP